MGISRQKYTSTYIYKILSMLPRKAEHFKALFDEYAGSSNPSAFFIL